MNALLNMQRQTPGGFSSEAAASVLIAYALR
jgi:hypothetical protein